MRSKRESFALRQLFFLHTNPGILATDLDSSTYFFLLFSQSPKYKCLGLVGPIGPYLSVGLVESLNCNFVLINNNKNSNN